MTSSAHSLCNNLYNENISCNCSHISFLYFSSSQSDGFFNVFSSFAYEKIRFLNTCFELVYHLFSRKLFTFSARFPGPAISEHWQNSQIEKDSIFNKKKWIEWIELNWMESCIFSKVHHFRSFSPYISGNPQKNEYWVIETYCLKSHLIEFFWRVPRMRAQFFE